MGRGKPGCPGESRVAQEKAGVRRKPSGAGWLKVIGWGEKFLIIVLYKHWYLVEVVVVVVVVAVVVVVVVVVAFSFVLVS